MKKIVLSLIFISLFVNACQAQKESSGNRLNGVNTELEIYNLKGHVKEIKSVTITNSEDQEAVQNKFYYNKDVGGGGYILYENGLLYKLFLMPALFDQKNHVYNMPSGNNNRIIDTIKIFSYIDTSKDRFLYKIVYDSIDLKKKMSFQPKYSFIEVLGEFNIEHDIYKLNVNHYKLDSKEENLSIYIYIYDFDTKGRIRKQKEYIKYYFDCVNYQDTLKIFNKSPQEHLSDQEDLKFEWDYHYDNQDRIVKLVMNNIEVDNKKDEGGNIINKKIYEFEYNDDNKVIELRVFDTGLKRPKEDLTKTYKYEYHLSEGYMISKEEILEPYYFYTRNDGGNYYYTDIHSKIHYNAYGNIVKREFLSDRSKAVNARKDPYEEWWRNPFAPRYYEYEYDKYNNWTKCTAYLRGIKTPKPSVVIEREITYYED